MVVVVVVVVAEKAAVDCAITVAGSDAIEMDVDDEDGGSIVDDAFTFDRVKVEPDESLAVVLLGVFIIAPLCSKFPDWVVGES